MLCPYVQNRSHLDWNQVFKELHTHSSHRSWWSSRRQLVPSFLNLLTRLLIPMGLILPLFMKADAFLPQPDCVQRARHIPSSPKHSSSAWHFGSLQHAKSIVHLLAISQCAEHGLHFIFFTTSLTYQYPKYLFPQNKCFILLKKTKPTYRWLGTNSTEQFNKCTNLYFH